ncbi:hypothetical protein [Natronorubrum daqingense]|uniref:Uncharacterized protein n=1 Tax=Natronorubrum daqingense TaxID=588898 RepID=A0A1N7G6D9_9EURY|nr:hypothetical protein [Natronorubrum daqingense]APX98691.1 hypothetical protein BB347_18455 [Natronorubrum daqingense]SIS08173.1 hypothetical protein SAMN05421809_3770 [Natronorubrum daqingense]
MATTTQTTQPATGRRATTIAREAGETILETLFHSPRQRCVPDGDWQRVDDTPLRKTWTRRTTTDRVQLASDGLSSRWDVLHQTPDGKQHTLETGLEREHAYRRAEEYMADLSSVDPRCRTGRASTEGA